MRSLPNMTIVVPGDTVAVAKLLPQVADWPGPVYFRTEPQRGAAVLFDDELRARRSAGGSAAAGQGRDPDRHRPDGQPLAGRRRAARRRRDRRGGAGDAHDQAAGRGDRRRGGGHRRALVTAEEHSIIGGLGGAVAETIADAYPVPVKRVGVSRPLRRDRPVYAIWTVTAVGARMWWLQPKLRWR